MTPVEKSPLRSLIFAAPSATPFLLEPTTNIQTPNDCPNGQHREQSGNPTFILLEGAMGRDLLKGDSARRELIRGTLYLLLLMLAAGPRLAYGQTYTILHKFTVAKGGLIFAGLITDGKGHFFGAASTGGSSNNGTVFKLGAGGAETVLHNFAGADGSGPATTLVRDAAGNFYGTTSAGGDPNCYGPSGNPGCGTVFKVSKSGGFSVLHTFTGGPSDGALPGGGGPLVLDASGNLYGVTWYGGTYEGGVIFKISSSGQMTILYNFGLTTNDASAPNAGLLLVGNYLYGTSEAGGAYGYGTVFRVSTSGSETVLHSFGKTGSGDGSQPVASLASDSAGNLYGTTAGGGTYNEGMVFELSNRGSESILYSFTGGSDGREPYAALTLDSAGNIYGSTVAGGTGTKCLAGCGVVFKLSQSGSKWSETVLHNFHGSDGALPEPILLLERGYLYGTTVSGGTSTCSYPGSSGCGVAFKLTP